jgi:hypothetical protein
MIAALAIAPLSVGSLTVARGNHLDISVSGPLTRMDPLDACTVP